MRTWTKALTWALILLACAAVGAFIASRSDPFPPGVRDPGELASATPSPAEETTEWTMTLVSRTSHRFRVGGSCRSDWRMTTTIRVSVGGDVRGGGVARLRPGAECDFPSAQLQTERVRLRIVGRLEREALLVRLVVADTAPAGSQDLGGFVETVGTLRVSLPERPGAEVTRSARVEDPEDEIYASVTTVRLSR